MVRPTPEREILSSIEDCVERQARAYPILQAPLADALIHATTAFEDVMRFTPPARAKIVNVKYALNHLICWILDNCPPGGSSKSPIDPSTYLAAGEALLFANSYEALLVAYRLYFHGHYAVEVTGNRLRFVARHARTANRDFVEHELWRRREESSVREILAIPIEGVLFAAERRLRRVDSQTVDYDIDPLVMDYCLRTVVDAVQATLPLDISNGSYTLGESREVWRVLMALAHCHAIHCMRAQTVGVKGGAVNSAVLRLDRTQLANLVSSFSELTPDTCDRVIADLILPPTGKRDLRAQPLIEVDGTVLLTPHLMVALAWEPCMQVLWNRLYSGVYGKYIADHKKSLAAEFAACFDHTRFAVSAMRKLRDPQSREVGDADVAIYDPRRGCWCSLNSSGLPRRKTYPKFSASIASFGRGLARRRRRVTSRGTISDGCCRFSSRSDKDWRHHLTFVLSFCAAALSEVRRSARLNQASTITRPVPHSRGN